LNAYLDSSVLLREILHQTPTLPEWDDLITGVCSELAHVECLRAVDRLRHAGKLDSEDVAEVHQRIERVFKRLVVLPLNAVVLTRASEPLPTSLSTLDAIHLATAHLHRATEPTDEPPIFFATFDLALAKAAHATGFRVLGATL